MASIDWHSLRSLNGSQNTAFEELCCQLATYETPQDAIFIRKGTPDAGVECFTILPDHSEWGWQAKFFDNMGQSQWSQIDNSVRTALEKHSRLVRYTICIPLDRADPRLTGQKSFLEKWDEHVAKWEKWAADLGMAVQFMYWGNHEILERLSREEHRGRYYYWFGKEWFSQTWFTNLVGEAIESAGPRYTPQVDVRLPIARLFDGLGRTTDFFVRIKNQLREIREAYSVIRLQSLSLDAETLQMGLQENVHHLSTAILDVDKSIPDLIPWDTIMGFTKQTLQTARSCIDHLNQIEQIARESKKEEPTKSITSGENLQLENERYHIHSFIGKVQELQRFIESDEVQLSNIPALLLSSEAGKGKTHLFCDIAQRRAKTGLPTILLMGQQFAQEEPWAQIIKLLHLNPDTTADEFLGALEAAGQACTAKALILIDALNEGEGRYLWKKHLAAILQKISRYPWISIAVSVRSSYEDVVIPKELTATKFIRVIHHGFADREYQATRTFFDYYGIEHPSIPLLIPEFQTPLFLKILCEGLHTTGASKIPNGLHGITAIFRLFVDAIDRKLSGESYLDYDHKSQIVWQAIDRIAEAMAQKQQDWLQREEAKEVTHQVLPTHGYEKSLFRHLVAEGILIEDGLRTDKNEWSEIIRFAYEKFSDHLVAKHLVDKYLGSNRPEKAFMSGQPLAFLTERQWGNEGLVEALCIQLPERVHKELPELVPTITDYGSVRKGFIESIIWRDPQAITESTRLFLNKYASQSQHTSDQVLNALLTVAVNPDHPYNADFLHVHLMNFEMAARDAWWSIFLHEQYGTHDSVDRLIDWAWSPEKKEHIADEAVRLAGTILGWFLTTSNRFLRDRATKALVNLLTSRVPVLHTLVQQFIQVNDPYILERLFAAAYGCVLRSIDDKAIGTFAQAVYNWIFREGTSPVHILLRDYARGIIEYALSKDIVLDVEVDKIRPPYRSEWPTIPTEDEIKQYDLPLGSYGSGDTAWSQNRIYHSIMADDFAWYVIGTNSGWSRWLSLPLNEPRWRSSKETCEEFAASLTGEKKIRWEQLQTLFEEYDRERDNWPIRSILEKLTDEQLQALIESSEEESEILLSTPQDIRLHFIDLEQEQKHQKLAKKIEKSTEQLRAILGDDEKHLFTTEILPYLSGSPQLRDAPRFDLALAQRWILKRVFELGWTMDRFGQFDRFHIGYEGRSGHKAERIGKKYQWIAYHEFLAMVADNFQFRRGHFDSDTEDKYVGAWQIGIRDIDPSCILKATGRGNSWQVHSPVWWFPHKYDSWENPTDEIEWMKRLDDLPNIESLIEVINPMDGSQWLTLDGYYTWEQPTPPEEEKFKISRREIWYILQSYLVHQPDVDDLFAWAKEQDFMGRWMPETHALGEVFLGEFFWSSTYKYFNDPHARVVSWQGDSPDSRIPKPIMPLADGYMQEDSGFDCSVDETINIKLPNQHLAEKMGLSWNGVEGSYFDKEGKLTVFDPSVRGNGPSVLLIERDAFLSFLAQNNYAVVWTILGEKQLIGGGFDHKNWKGRMKLSGAYRFLKDQLEGKITPTFQAPANASRT